VRTSHTDVSKEGFVEYGGRGSAFGKDDAPRPVKKVRQKKKKKAGEGRNQAVGNGGRREPEGGERARKKHTVVRHAPAETRVFREDPTTSRWATKRKLSRNRKEKQASSSGGGKATVNVSKHPFEPEKMGRQGPSPGN